MRTKKKRSPQEDLRAYYEKRLKGRVRTAPFVLRATEHADKAGPVLIIKERAGRKANEWVGNRNDEPSQKRRHLVGRGVIHGESQRRCLPVLKRIVEGLCDEGGVPLELQRFLTTAALRQAWTLPLSEEAGAKLGLIFKLQERMKDMDRVELIVRRVARFSREEAGYWYSRLHSFGAEANRWAAAGMRVMLGGQPRDPGVGRMLERLRARTE